MITDEEFEKSKEKRFIEILIDQDGVSFWIMACATDLRILGNDRELRSVKALRVRKI